MMDELAFVKDQLTLGNQPRGLELPRDTGERYESKRSIETFDILE